MNQLISAFTHHPGFAVVTLCVLGILFLNRIFEYCDFICSNSDQIPGTLGCELSPFFSILSCNEVHLFHKTQSQCTLHQCQRSTHFLRTISHRQCLATMLCVRDNDYQLHEMLHDFVFANVSSCMLVSSYQHTYTNFNLFILVHIHTA